MQTQTKPHLRTIIVPRDKAIQTFTEIEETLRSDPTLHCPPSLAAILAAEMDGRVWNFVTGKFEPEDA
ncbi:MAG TPA: hypothetical protein PL105_03610 [Caldilineaceae bacterium]|nr:hypothetical protein [Caldilineaceae bacterium]